MHSRGWRSSYCCFLSSTVLRSCRHLLMSRPPFCCCIVLCFPFLQLVDIKGNGAVQKGLPHKFYHGKTGVVWNVTPRAIGIQVNKLHRNRIIRKKIHVRIEHVKKSTCRDDFLNRVRKNEQIKKDARATGKRVEIKRLPVQPRGRQFVKGANVQDLFPLAYAGLNV
jgi:large subunit ribosomal protein L21e